MKAASITTELCPLILNYAIIEQCLSNYIAFILQRAKVGAVDLGLPDLTLELVGEGSFWKRDKTP